ESLLNDCQRLAQRNGAYGEYVLTAPPGAGFLCKIGLQRRDKLALLVGRQRTASARPRKQLGLATFARLTHARQRPTRSGPTTPIGKSATGDRDHEAADRGGDGNPAKTGAGQPDVKHHNAPPVCDWPQGLPCAACAPLRTRSGAGPSELRGDYSK